MPVFADIFRKGCVVIGALVLVCQTFSVPRLSAEDESGGGVVDAFIAAQARKLRGEEDPEARRVVSGDLNHDGQADLAVQYTLESLGGGNGYRLYLAVFLNRQGQYVYAASRQVGGKLQRDVTLQAIEDGKVRVDTLKYEPQDPSCCPSKSGHAVFVLRGKQLKEQ